METTFDTQDERTEALNWLREALVMLRAAESKYGVEACEQREDYRELRVKANEVAERVNGGVWDEN